MALKVMREIARADMNDEFGVSVWQERKLTEYTVEEAELLAGEILQAAGEARRAISEDFHDREAARVAGGQLSAAETAGAI